MAVSSSLLTAARLLAKAERVVVLTGAGISEESGVPTYRGVAATSGKNGLWKETLGAMFFGTKWGWLLAPARAWELYVDRLLRPILLAQPNAAHRALVELEQIRQHSELPIITQNVDGLHSQAGSSDVYEVHGTVRQHRCTWNHQRVEIDQQAITVRNSNQLPDCPQCWFGAARPRVVLFGESLPLQVWSEAYQHVQELEPNDVLLVVGTSCQVQPVACLPQVALEQGATVVEVNASEEPCITRELIYYMTDGDHNITASSTRWVPPEQLIHLPGKAGVVLPQLVELVKDEWEQMQPSKSRDVNEADDKIVKINN